MFRKKNQKKFGDLEPGKEIFRVDMKIITHKGEI